jgi:hypothetical protein
MCEEARVHLSMGMRRKWSAPAIARTTPFILTLYPIATLMAAH